MLSIDVTQLGLSLEMLNALLALSAVLIGFALLLFVVLICVKISG
nr:MAG TPA: TMEM210 family [Inoviridae sp.]